MLLTRVQSIGIGRLVDAIESAQFITLLPGPGRPDWIAGRLCHLCPTKGSKARLGEASDVRLAYVRITALPDVQVWVPLQDLVDAYVRGDLFFGRLL